MAVISYYQGLANYHLGKYEIAAGNFLAFLRDPQELDPNHKADATTKLSECRLKGVQV